MSKKVTNPTEEEIDQLVIADADNDSAWGKPVRVRGGESSAVSLPAELASRAAFFARLHRESSVQEWLKRIIEERIDIEEAVFTESKRDLAKR
jgi:hypothetical protein